MIPEAFGEKMIDPLQVLGNALYGMATAALSCTDDARKKSGKKSADDEAKDNDKLAEIVRILSPIFPATVLDPVSLKLYEHANYQFSELFDV